MLFSRSSSLMVIGGTSGRSLERKLRLGRTNSSGGAPGISSNALLSETSIC